MGEEAESIEAIRIKNGACKEPGCSVWIDSSNIIGEFCVGDTMHAQSDAKLEDIAHKMS